MFQSTHPRGVRPGVLYLCHTQTRFNPRTHVGCDQINALPLQRDKSFNPRTHVGCDVVEALPKDPLRVSIHAPTWGATGYIIAAIKSELVSIHAPTWGATPPYVPRPCNTPCFNPRTHVGCDPRLQTKNNKQHVSIHAPTWGATILVEILRTRCYRFNPRTHVGCDKSTRCRRSATKVSIHAPTWGATDIFLSSYANKKFQSTHPRGVRHDGIHQRANSGPGFNPRTHVGCDPPCRCCRFGERRFQSTHPRGVRPTAANYRANIHSFNPRTHVGCDCIFNKALNITLQRYLFCEKETKRIQSFE